MYLPHEIIQHILSFNDKRKERFRLAQYNMIFYLKIKGVLSMSLRRHPDGNVKKRFQRCIKTPLRCYYFCYCNGERWVESYDVWGDSCLEPFYY